MSLKPCHECKHQVSDDAKNCPSCGAKQKKPVGLVGWIFAIFIGFIAFQCTRPGTTISQPLAAKTPAEIAAEEAANNAFKARAAFGAEMIDTIQSNLRDPASLIIESLLINDNASVGCAGYRAKNGFGGTNREHVIFVNGKAKKGADAWNKHCLKGMNDLMELVK